MPKYLPLQHYPRHPSRAFQRKDYAVQPQHLMSAGYLAVDEPLIARYRGGFIAPTSNPMAPRTSRR